MEETVISTSNEKEFQLQFSVKDSRLYLHIQNPQDGKEFIFELESPIGQTTKNLSLNAQSVNQIFQEASSPTSNDIKFSVKTSEKELSFEINRKEDNEEVLEDFDFSFYWGGETSKNELVEGKAPENELTEVKRIYQRELDKIRSEYEEKIARLRQMVLKEQEKNVKMQAEYEAKLSRIKKGTPRVPTFDQIAPRQIRFRRDTPSASNFEFSDNDKTAKLVKLKEKRTLRCYPKVPGTGKNTFSLKVNQIKSWIAFGITTKEEGEVERGGQGNYFYFIGDGMFLKKDDKRKNTTLRRAGEKNSIVEMMVDMNARDLVFYVDGRQVRSCKLDFDKAEYIVFVEFANLEDSVTLLYCS